MATGTETVMTPPTSAVAHGFYNKNHTDGQIDDGGVRHRRTQFHQLRHDVARLDGQSRCSRLPFHVESLDSALAGGLALGRVHMLCGRPGHDGALTGFAVALLRRLLSAGAAQKTADLPSGPAPDGPPDGPIVWCPAAAGSGSGMLYAAGLAALGLDPGRLLIVDSPSPGQRLAALEDILRTDGLAAVVVEYDGLNQSSDYWMRLARRAQLAAEASGVTGFLMGWPVSASGFETRWQIAPASVTANVTANGTANDPRHAINPWHPVWDISLTHARNGRPHDVRLQWDAASNRFHADRFHASCFHADRLHDCSQTRPAVSEHAAMLPFDSRSTGSLSTGTDDRLAG